MEAERTNGQITLTLDVNEAELLGEDFITLFNYLEGGDDLILPYLARLAFKLGEALNVDEAKAVVDEFVKKGSKAERLTADWLEQTHTFAKEEEK